MNWRAIGCLGVGLLLFVAIGVVGLNLATTRVGCPARLVWQDEAWEPDGSPTAQPRIGSSTAEPVEIGAALIGLATRRVYGPAGSAPVTGTANDLPAQLAVECGDGTFQSYRATVSRGAPPNGSP
ncbi:MAG TPA: hypothetical protein VFM19_00405 [Candidatus Limnocylindria bacterium]|nr:hypothetical protein [Candidatus Limnocylindria bacterium]